MVIPDVQRIGSAAARRARSGLRNMRARISGKRRPVILMYHRIADETFDPWGLAVAPRNFAGQLAWLTRHRTPISLAEFANLHRRRALPDDAVAITFDDGYSCTAKVAAPLLDRFEVPATIFLPAGLIDRTRHFWWDELRQIVMSHPGTGLEALGQTFDIGERHERDSTWPSDTRKRTKRQNSFYALWSRLQPMPRDTIDAAMAELRVQGPLTDLRGAPALMSVDEARSIRSETIGFGSHAMTHASLPSLPAAEKAREIRNSIRACKQLTGDRPKTFAYPFGDFDTECMALVAKAGFACACTVEPRPVDPDDDPFALPRLRVGNWSWRQLRQKLADAAGE